MPGYKTRPESIVNQIKSNLRDRYDSGYLRTRKLS